MATENNKPTLQKTQSQAPKIVSAGDEIFETFS